MSLLPPALRPWAPFLSVFPTSIALSLGPLVQRVSSALGPLHGAPDPGPGEPDGYTGLARRGPYERLLTTEWLLADALPDEFLRRAAEGEHAFLQLAHRTPGRTRRTVVVFDEGVEQLGAPRVVHVAVLVALAARASRAGVGFAWGTLRGDRLVDGFSQQGVRVLLDARSALDPTAAQFTAWQTRLAQEARRPGAPPHAQDDVWLVAGPRGLEEMLGAGVFGARPSCIEVVDAARAEDPTLSVTIRSRAVRTITLERPPHGLDAAVLRKPFKAVVPRAPSPGTPSRGRREFEGPLVGAPRFSQDGRWVLSEHASGTVMAREIPQDGRPSQSRRLHREQDERALAYGFVNHKLALLSHGARDEFVLRRLGKHGRRDTVTLRAPGSTEPSRMREAVVPLGPLWEIRRGSGGLPSLAFVDERGTLFTVHDGVASERAWGVRDLVACSASGTLAWVGPVAGRGARRLHLLDDTRQCSMTPVENWPCETLRLGANTTNQGWFTPLALATGSGAWAFVGIAGLVPHPIGKPMTLPAELRLIGPVLTPQDQGSLLVIHAQDTRHRVVQVSHRDEQPAFDLVHQASGSITHASLSPSTGRLLWVEDDAALVVLDLRTRAVLARWPLATGSDA